MEDKSKMADVYLCLAVSSLVLTSVGGRIIFGQFCHSAGRTAVARLAELADEDLISAIIYMIPFVFIITSLSQAIPSQF